MGSYRIDRYYDRWHRSGQSGPLWPITAAAHISAAAENRSPLSRLAPHCRPIQHRAVSSVQLIRAGCETFAPIVNSLEKLFGNSRHGHRKHELKSNKKIQNVTVTDGKIIVNMVAELMPKIQRPVYSKYNWSSFILFKSLV